MPPEPVERATPHFVAGREGRRPRAIVAHTTVGSFDATVAWFADPGSGVSAHYLVRLDGRVAQFVDERDTAHHAGRARRPATRLFAEADDANLETIGIEFEDGGDPEGASRTDAQYRAGAELIASAAARWEIPLDRDHLLAHREIDASQSCPGNLDLERLVAEARAARDGRVQKAGRPRLVCLLPARNAAQELPGWLESAGRFADAVLALDDGSTDATGELLERSPLVEAVLRNPGRRGYAGWDDAGNRNRLLEAAETAAVDWLMWLDADERLAADDAAALRELVDRDALPGVAYGFRVHRMVGDDRHYDGSGLWVYRLFAHAPGQRLAPRRLHGVPVPDEIPRERWLRTTIRIQHLASLDPERRRERFDKYAEADPGAAYQPAGYGHLLAPPGPVRTWLPREPDAPLLEPAGDGAARALPLETVESELEGGPALSAIVISHDDEDRIERVVRAVVEQECPEPFEVIVVASGADRTAAIVRERFPEVTVVELAGRALPGAARNAGLRVARGEFVSFPGSHVELPPGSLAARLRAHRAGHAMVTGTIYNGTLTPAGWASYFLDHSAWLPGRPSGPLAGPPDHCSYMRHHLLQVGGFREDMRAGEDTLANRELARLGYRGWRAADVRLQHRSPCRTVARLAAHHFTRGRALGRIWAEGGGPVLARLARYLPRRMRTTTANVRRWGGPLERVYRRVLPLVMLGATAAWLGCAYESLVSRARRAPWTSARRRPWRSQRRRGRPARPS